MRAPLSSSKGLGGVERSALKKLVTKFSKDSNANIAKNVIICDDNSITIILCFFLQGFPFLIPVKGSLIPEPVF